MEEVSKTFKVTGGNRERIKVVLKNFSSRFFNSNRKFYTLEDYADLRDYGVESDDKTVYQSKTSVFKGFFGRSKWLEDRELLVDRD